ncbi:hypothetical protein [Roseateles sp.]|uniref:hypothetical protein n=1 Tax=Roseateles sp. TaxID=1971397 RepID=UPI002DFBFF6C|nr:hypothetical protein [Roseateles sp.]
MSIDWTTRQLGLELARRGALEPLHVHRYNPRPAGVIRDRSATQAVQTVLQMRPGVFFTHSTICFLTGRTTKAVCFALRYLQGQGVVRSVPDATRNPRYLRYSATAAGVRRAQQLQLWDYWPAVLERPRVVVPNPEKARLRSQLTALINRAPRWVVDGSVPVVRAWLARRELARRAVANPRASVRTLRHHIEALTTRISMNDLPERVNEGEVQ